jgi:outer membrane protein assembly factor BamB
VFLTAYPLALRRWTFYGALIGIACLVATFRLVEVRGSVRPSFAFRWTWRPPDSQLAKPATEGENSIDLTTTTPEDFPEFLGPGRKCWLSGPELADDWGTQPPKLLWKQPIGAGWSGFAAVNAYAVTMEQRGPDEWVTCYEIASGKPIWGHSIEGRHENKLGGIGPRSTPTIHAGRVYALGATGVLRCLDGATGKLLWSDDLRSRYQLTAVEDEGMVMWGRAGSPLIVDSLVVVAGGGKEPKNLVAFDAASGRLVWEATNIKEDGTPDQIGYASPALATLAGRKQITIVNASTASGHDPATGERLWSFPWPGHSNGDACTSQAALVDDRHLLLSKGYSAGSELIEISADSSGERFSATSVWKSPKSLQTKLTNVVVYGGHAFGLSEGILECVDLENGKRKWKSGRFGHGQILGVGDKLLVVSEEGDLALVEANPTRFVQLGVAPALEGKTWNTLCLFGRRLVIRNGQEAACFELP